MSAGLIARAHGGGGAKMRDLINGLFLSRFNNPHLAKMNDFASLELPPGRVALTTDTYVVDPWRFPGGNIGDLAICGTVNDLAMSGARPLYLSAGFILPEGFPLADLEEIADAMAARAREAGVLIVTGDTKVVEPGIGPFINTSGVGVIPQHIEIGGEKALPGDAVIVTGPIGNHGIAVLSRREGIGFGTEITSDVAPLAGMLARLVGEGLDIHAMRDPTRGGVAGALNEIAQQSGVEIEIDEANIPLEAGVKSACALLGYDPLHVACEGRALIVLAANDAQRALTLVRENPYGRGAEIIGRTLAGKSRVVSLTILGARRLVDQPSGELLPRIC